MMSRYEADDGLDAVCSAVLTKLGNRVLCSGAGTAFDGIAIRIYQVATLLTHKMCQIIDVGLALSGGSHCFWSSI